MKTPGSGSKLVGILERLYRTGLRAFPSAFRDAFGREMTEAFRDSCVHVRANGRGRLAVHALRALVELVIQGLAERVTRLRGREGAGARAGSEGEEPGLGGRGRRPLREMAESVLGDVGHAFRGLRKNPGFTLAVVSILALGIGANTAIFSVVSGVLLRPLPYPNPQELVNVWQVNEEWLDSPDPRFRAFGREFPASYPVVEDWVREANALVEVGGYAMNGRSLELGDRVERISTADVTSGVFSALAVQPLLGRVLREQDDRIGSASVAVISQGLWRRNFGADSSVVGRAVSLDGRSFEVVGVMPPGFYFPDPDCDVWANIVDRRREAGRGEQYLRAVGRLRPRLAVEAAQAEMEELNRRLMEANRGEDVFGVRVNLRTSQVVGDVRPVLLILLGSVALVLLIACANIANLLLMRSASRKRELAVRAALGAGRGRLLRLLVIESLVMGFLSGVVGLALAYATFEPMVAWLPTRLPRLNELSLDYRVLLFCFGASLITGLLVGILPALSASRISVAGVLKEGGRSLSAGVHRRRIQGALVIVEIALAFVLLMGSGLLMKSFVRLTTVERGFDPVNLLVLSVPLPEEGYSDAETRLAFLTSLEERLSALPGVRGVALANSLPFYGGTASRDMNIETQSELRTVNFQAAEITSGFFSTLGIPILSGRGFEETDGPGSDLVTVINATAASQLWPEENPVGRRIRWSHRGGESGPWTTIIGVAGDVRSRLDRDPRPKYYLSAKQIPDTDFRMAVKTIGDPNTLAAQVREILRELEPRIPVPTFSTLEDRIANSVATPRLQTTLVTALGCLAGLLALVGVYGLLAYATAQRTAEFGIRIALGAKNQDVSRDVLARGAVYAGVGLALGAGASLAAVRALESVLFRTDVYDPVMFIGVGALLGFAALMASYIPARRATRVDPVEALRSE